MTSGMIRDRVSSAVVSTWADELLTLLTLRRFFAEQYPNDGLVRNYLLGYLSDPLSDYEEIECHYQRSSSGLGKWIIQLDGVVAERERLNIRIIPEAPFRYRGQSLK